MIENTFAKAGLYVFLLLLLNNNNNNKQIPSSEAINTELVSNTPCRQKDLSGKLEDNHFKKLFDSSSLSDRARLLSVSSPHAAAWLSIIPSPRLNLHLEPLEFQTAIQWWLGMGASQINSCPYCPAHSLDPMGHHAFNLQAWRVTLSPAITIIICNTLIIIIMKGCTGTSE